MPFLALALMLSAASASEQLAEAQRLYGALKYERALGVATSALTAPDLATGARADAYLLIGLCRAQLGADDQARAAFAEALSLNADARLPAGAPPKIRRLFEAERARLPPPVPPPDAPALTPPPVLVPVAAAPTPQVEVVQPAAPAPLPRWPAFTAMGLGLAAGGAGTAFAVLARSQAEAAAQAEWADDRARLNGRALADATAANVLFVSGAVLLGAGLTYLVVEEV
ncbi:MAG: hypothetical protein K1X89_02495, partial [Myxococcaceae bacterium]|nr:hypothetical protein [Myxococcaceae bacterium]